MIVKTEADIERILDAACYTSAQTSAQVCDLLERAIAKVRSLSAQAEALQSRRHGDPGTGLVEAIYYVPEAEAARFEKEDIPISAAPNFVLAASRICPQS